MLKLSFFNKKYQWINIYKMIWIHFRKEESFHLKFIDKSKAKLYRKKNIIWFIQGWSFNLNLKVFKGIKFKWKFDQIYGEKIFYNCK